MEARRMSEALFIRISYQIRRVAARLDGRGLKQLARPVSFRPEREDESLESPVGFCDHLCYTPSPFARWRRRHPSLAFVSSRKERLSSITVLPTSSLRG